MSLPAREVKRSARADFLRPVPPRWLALAVMALVGAALCGAAPRAPRLSGRVFHVAPGGNDAHPGTAGSPWKTIGKAAATARAGDTVILHGGIYREPLEPAHAGTGERARLVFKAAPGEEVILEGGSGRITGWTHEGNNIYRKPWTSHVEGVFQDTYETAGKHTALWNMGDFGSYGANPHRELHDFDPSHDYWNGRQEAIFKMHDWRSQYKWADGMLRVRTWDGRSPDEHDVRTASLSGGILLNGKPFVTVEGIKVRRFRNAARIEQSPHARLVNCDLRYSARSGIWIYESDHVEIRDCVIQGGGSWIGHYEDVVGMKGTNGARFEGNDMSYGGHGGMLILGGEGLVLRKNHIHDMGGTLVAILRGANRSLVEDNVFARAPFRAQTSVHKTPHAALQMTGIGHVYRRNLVYDSGVGIALYAGGSEASRNNLFYNNTIVNCEKDCFEIGAPSAEEASLVSDNQFKNNIIMSAGLSLTRLDLIGGEKGDFFGNRFEGNLFYDGRLNPWGSTVSIADAQRHWPAVFKNNVEADPRFVDAKAGDFRLRPGSPAIGRGVAHRLSGAEGAAPDIGALGADGRGPRVPAAAAK